MAADPNAGTGGAAADSLPVVDTVWREVYHVTGALADGGWTAARTDTEEKVMLQAIPVDADHTRDLIWDRLCLARLSHVQKAREAHPAGDKRVEVYDAVTGTPLDAWRAGRASVDAGTVESIVKQIAEGLMSLHSTGLAHLGLRPGVVFVQEGENGVSCTLAGLDRVAMTDGAQLVSMQAEPLYAPPEAAGLSQHEPGAGLSAWDWWSLGRVIQELVLGRHVVDELPSSVEEAGPAGDRAARALALLQEVDLQGPRAGAVEVMKDLDPRLDMLLRGLLTTVRDARWGRESVERWLNRQEVAHGYDTPKVDDRFPWRGRRRTVAEVAREMRMAEFWDEAASQVFDVEKSGTLAHFVTSSAVDQATAHLYAGMLRMATQEPLASQPQGVARDIVQAMALMCLAGEKFIWRGRRLDAASLRALVAEDPANPERLAFARTLTHAEVASHIDPYDFEAGRSLGEIGRLASDAEAIVRRHGWLAPEDAEAGTRRLFQLSLDPEAELRAAHQRLKKTFASVRDPEADKFFRRPEFMRAELVALAWVEPLAEKNGFVSHAVLAAEELKRLHEGARPLVIALFWGRCAKALSSGPLIFGTGRRWLAGWAAAVLLTGWLWAGWGGWVAAAGLAGLAVLAKLAALRLVRSALKRHMPEVSNWTWRDGVDRCRREWEAASQGRDERGLIAALRETNASIAKLAEHIVRPAAVAEPSDFRLLRVAALGSWAMLVFLLAGMSWRVVIRPPVWPWRGGAKVVEAAQDKLADGVAEDDSAKLSWPHRMEGSPETPRIKDVWRASDLQLSYARARARKFFAPYRRDTVEAPVIFEVPAGDAIGVMIFDPVRNAPASDRIYILEQLPRTRTWLRIDGLTGIYLAE